jgi:hypothetical protein
MATLDKTGDSYEHRHNQIRGLIQDMVVADLPLLLIFLALAALTIFVDAGRKATRPTGSPASGWYDDPTGRFVAREWTGRRWSNRVIHDGRLTRDQLEHPS